MQNKKVVIAIFTILILGSAYFLISKSKTTTLSESQSQSSQQNSAQNLSSAEQSPTNNSNTNTDGTNEEKPLPTKVSLKVPFSPQAPTANWDELHNQACEEVSGIMANAYFNGVTSLPTATVEKEINALTKWQQDNFGYNLSITTEETVKMIEANFKLKVEIATIDENTIKRALSENKLVLLPANGQMLNNPYFKQPGPVYHMLVLTGYNKDTFITNDPGTKRGENYEYKYSTLEAATGNWNHDTESVNLSDKKIIIVSKLP